MNSYTIKLAAKLSGVSELTIRAWEARYGAVNPERSGGNRRLYSEHDIRKLAVLKNLTALGYRIGNIAGHPLTELYALNENGPAKAEDEEHSKFLSPEEGIISECLNAITGYEGKALYNLLNEASVRLPQLQLIERVIIPLIERVGELWRKGVIRVAHEHFASAVIRRFLGNIPDGYKIPHDAPRVIIATPEGQYHETGAMIGALLFASYGWRTTFLGASLCAEEIASAAEAVSAKCVHLSIVYPADDPGLPAQLLKLRELLGESACILVTGSALRGYLRTLEAIGALISNNVLEFESHINFIREKINPNLVNDSLAESIHPVSGLNHLSLISSSNL